MTAPKQAQNVPAADSQNKKKKLLERVFRINRKNQLRDEIEKSLQINERNFSDDGGAAAGAEGGSEAEALFDEFDFIDKNDFDDLVQKED